ncbi:MAG: hypothetical protein ABIE36_03600 [Candidatus Diapherotrites archaeon]
MKKTIPKRPYQRWDGELIYKTKDCDSCDFYRMIFRNDLCGWGIAFKYLVQKEKPKKCEIRNRPIETCWTHHSLEYLDSLIREDGFKNKQIREYPPREEFISMPEIKEIH